MSFLYVPNPPPPGAPAIELTCVSEMTVILTSRLIVPFDNVWWQHLFRVQLRDFYPLPGLP